MRFSRTTWPLSAPSWSATLTPHAATTRGTSLQTTREIRVSARFCRSMSTSTRSGCKSWRRRSVAVSRWSSGSSR
uniref:Putative caseinolytic peptidase b n=1 Tax=Ixodes ricinus TaxID=34613 RepID=A0A147BTU0_IXORI